MFGQLKIYQLLHDDEDGPGDVADVPLGHTGDMEILERGVEDDEEVVENEDEEEAPETFAKKDDDEDKEEAKDDDEKEEEAEEAFEGRPSLTDIKTKYPKIFKEFPELREVLFREDAFTKEFGTVEEAQEASSKARSFNVIEASLLGGDPTPIIEQLGQNDPEALGKVVDNFLPTLLKQSESLYLRATVPIVEQFLWTLHEHGKKSGDVNLVRSAQHASNYIFGKPEVPDPAARNRTAGPHPAEQKLEQERSAWAKERFYEASNEISTQIDGDLKGEVLKGLDPDKVLNEWQRGKLTDDILAEIDATLQGDQAFQRQMKALWQKAAASGYPRDQRASIKSAFLARAKALVPAVRSRLRAKALGQKVANPGNGQPKGDSVKKRALPDSGRAGGNRGSRPPAPREVDYSRTSDEDLIAGRFTRRK